MTTSSVVVAMRRGLHVSCAGLATLPSAEPPRSRPAGRWRRRSRSARRRREARGRDGRRRGRHGRRRRGRRRRSPSDVAGERRQRDHGEQGTRPRVTSAQKLDGAPRRPPAPDRRHETPGAISATSSNRTPAVVTSGRPRRRAAATSTTQSTAAARSFGTRPCASTRSARNGCGWVDRDQRSGDVEHDLGRSPPARHRDAEPPGRRVRTVAGPATQRTGGRRRARRSARRRGGSRRAPRRGPAGAPDHPLRRLVHRTPSSAGRSNAAMASASPLSSDARRRRSGSCRRSCQAAAPANVSPTLR